MDYLHFPVASFTDNKTTGNDKIGHFGCQFYNGKLFVSLNIFMLLWREHIELIVGEFIGHVEMNIPKYISLLGWSREEIVDALMELHGQLAAWSRDLIDPLDSSSIDSAWSRPDNAHPSQPYVA